jgi:hypothetical protein
VVAPRKGPPHLDQVVEGGDPDRPGPHREVGGGPLQLVERRRSGRRAEPPSDSSHRVDPPRSEAVDGRLQPDPVHAVTGHHHLHVVGGSRASLDALGSRPDQHEANPPGGQDLEDPARPKPGARDPVQGRPAEERTDGLAVNLDPERGDHGQRSSARSEERLQGVDAGHDQA